MQPANKLPKYRTIQECLAIIKGLDEGTAITEFFIRSLCKNNQIKYLPSGNKSLVQLDSLLSFLEYEEAGYEQT